MINNRRKRLGELLIEKGLITRKQLDRVLEIQRETGKRLGEILIEEGLIDERQIVEILETQLGIPRIDLSKYFIEPEIPRLIGENLARKHQLIPVYKDGNQLTVAMADPLNIFAIDDVHIATGLEIKPVIADRKSILSAIDQYYGKESAEKAVEEFKKQYHIEQISEEEDELLSEVSNAPVVRLVNLIIQQAIKAKASDIHIEPGENAVRIRFRIDGELHDIMTSSKNTHSPIVTRIKIMGKMDIAEKRIPQDGRVETTVDGKEVDLRISILPTVYGEKIVIRLLDRSSFIFSKSQLGLNPENVQLFNRIIQNPHGIILVTGPTGSGKTTTLYATLQELNQSTRNIITIEDPVEYRMEGINQVQVNTKAGLTFAAGLRAILRQDPDIIMIGEIRDTETAEIAVRASITGHLVLSTMHTNDSASTVTRLLDMGIEPYLVSSSLVGVVSQRLVKKICENCQTVYEPNEVEKELLGLQEDRLLRRGQGCSLCHGTGYRGRTAVHEIMVINREMRELIGKGASEDVLREAAIRHGTISLKENCRRLVLDGITTTEELLRVAYTLD